MKKDRSDLLLLDVNVLVALAWPNHPFHAAAQRRLKGSDGPWATCATTQLGFIRVSSNPAINETAVTPSTAAALLDSMARDPLHRYLNETPAPAETASAFAGIRGYRQVTDAYLVKVAQRHGARFLTLDVKLRDMAGVEVLV